MKPQAINQDFLYDVKQHLETRFSDAKSAEIQVVKAEVEEQMTIADKLKDPESNLEGTIESLRLNWERWQKFIENTAETDSNRSVLTDSRTALTNIKKGLADVQEVYKKQAEAEESNFEITVQRLKDVTAQIQAFNVLLEKMGAEKPTLESIKTEIQRAMKFQYKIILHKLNILEAVKKIAEVSALSIPDAYVAAAQQKEEQEAERSLPNYHYTLKLQMTLSFLSILLENNYGVESYNDVLEQIIRVNFKKEGLDEEEFEKYRQRILESGDTYYAGLAQEEHLSIMANQLKANMIKATQKINSPQAVYDTVRKVDNSLRSVFKNSETPADPETKS